MNGPDVNHPATLGGRGWLPRVESHAEELKTGKYWSTCGLDSEVAPLRAVALAEPPASLFRMRDANDSLALRRPDADAMRRQFADLVGFFERREIRIEVLRDPGAPPNIIFMRDLYVMTPEGAIMGRCASVQRADEVRLASKFLAAMGIPIVGMVIGHGTFEGADCLWITPRKVMIGVGTRTNRAGAAQVARLLKGIGVESEIVNVPRGSQHLLGIVNFLVDDLAAVDAELTGPDVVDALHAAGVATIAIEDHEELRRGRALNFLALGDGQVLAPAGPVAAYARYARAGIEVHTLDVGEYIACAGAIGCAVGIMERQQG